MEQGHQTEAPASSWKDMRREKSQQIVEQGFLGLMASGLNEKFQGKDEPRFARLQNNPHIKLPFPLLTENELYFPPPFYPFFFFFC